MNVTIEIDSPKLLPKLVAGLKSGGCLTELIDKHACRVVNPVGDDEHQAMCELRFYVRAWALKHGNVAVNLRREP
jgi:hypothetical protein